MLGGAAGGTDGRFLDSHDQGSLLGVEAESVAQDEDAFPPASVGSSSADQVAVDVSAGDWDDVLGYDSDVSACDAAVPNDRLGWAWGGHPWKAGRPTS